MVGLDYKKGSSPQYSRPDGINAVSSCKLEAASYSNRYNKIDKMNKKKSSKTYIACCGAYCRTCKPYNEGHCKGCKIGYESGERDIDRAKCKIKLCCFRDNKFDICSECDKFSNCKIFNGRFKVGTRDNKKYQEALVFIKKNGYSKFIELADQWTGPCGKLK